MSRVQLPTLCCLSSSLPSLSAVDDPLKHNIHENNVLFGFFSYREGEICDHILFSNSPRKQSEARLSYKSFPHNTRLFKLKVKRGLTIIKI